MKKWEFSNEDLSLCTWLVSLWFELKSVDSSDPNRVRFVFDSNERLLEIVELFYQKKLQCEITSIFANQRLLKNKIYQIKNSTH